MNLKDKLNKFKAKDIYTLVLFALYQMHNIPEYSTLSELAYVLDRESLLKLCELFGGTIIKIPTIDEIESLIYSLTIYQQVNIDGLEFDEVIDNISHTVTNLTKVKKDYFKLIEIIENYNVE